MLGELQAGANEFFSEAPSREVRPHPEAHIQCILPVVEARPPAGRDPGVLAEAEVSDEFSVAVVDGVVEETRLKERRDGGRVSVVDRIGPVVAPARDGLSVGVGDRSQGKAQRRRGRRL